MATLETHSPVVRTPTPITSVQPGGGFCMSLERSWGRLRRAWLRRFRPGYVRRMIAKRQGHCPDCPHEIIDTRDWKLYRNVCGYWFRDEDDPFRWRNHLGLARAGLAELFFFSALLLGTAGAFALAAVRVHGAFGLVSAAAIAVWLFVVSFFRDPPRAIPADPLAVLSPADGTVTDVGEVAEPDFPGGRAFRIGIFLSVVSVHVNRIPRTGRVANLRYFPGSFLDARSADCNIRNEQLWIDLTDTTGRPLRVKQIAGAVARRIVCWLRPGEEVRAGDKLGMIKFGSRTELFLPAGEACEVRVKVGDKVRGGATVLLRLGPDAAERTGERPV